MNKGVSIFCLHFLLKWKKNKSNLIRLKYLSHISILDHFSKIWIARKLVRKTIGKYSICSKMFRCQNCWNHFNGQSLKFSHKGLEFFSDFQPLYLLKNVRKKYWNGPELIRRFNSLSYAKNKNWCPEKSFFFLTPKS